MSFKSGSLRILGYHRMLGAKIPPAKVIIRYFLRRVWKQDLPRRFLEDQFALLLRSLWTTNYFYLSPLLPPPLFYYSRHFENEKMAHDLGKGTDGSARLKST
jgi:hypothetical protein